MFLSKYKFETLLCVATDEGGPSPRLALSEVRRGNIGCKL